MASMDEEVGRLAELFSCDPLDLPFALNLLHGIEEGTDQIHPDHRVVLNFSLERYLEETGEKAEEDELA